MNPKYGRFLRQEQPNAYTCIPTAFAIIINEPVNKILEALGHDGSGEHKGFHVQEIISVIYPWGWAVTQFDYVTRLHYDTYIQETVWELPLTRVGVIFGDFNGQAHAAAWDGQLVFNPNGSLHSLDLIDNISMFCAVDKIIV